jgi:hypothetical protein
MTLTVRSATVSGATTKGSALTHAELDENFNHLSQASNHTFTPSGSGALSRTVQAKERATVSVEDFGTNTTPGTTDMSAAILAAITALPSSGGVVEFELADRYACNLGAITKNNVCFRAKGFLENTAVNAQLVSLDSEAYVLEVGDGTTLCKGFRTEGVSLNGLGTSKYGMKINGADRCHYSQFSAAGFTVHDVYITSSATHPTTYQFFDTFSISAQNGATAIGLEIDYGSQYVAAIFFNNGTIGGQASSLWALKMTRVRAFFSNVWIQGAASGNCISLNTSGGTNAVMECANVYIDSDSSADVLVNVDANSRVNNWLRGTVYVDGVVAMPGGNTAALSNRAILPANSYLTSCFVNGSGLFFSDTALSEWARWDQSATQMSMARSGTNLAITNTAGGVNVTGAAGSALAYVGREIRLIDSSGQRTNTLHATDNQTVSGATFSFTNLIPAGSMVIGVTVRVTQTVTGATSFEVGDGTDPDRWGTAIAVTSGTTTTIASFTITNPVYYTTATSVVLTANGSNFSGGQVRATVHYMQLVAATS